MKYLFLLMLLNTLSFEEVSQDDNVYVLTDANFKDFVSQHKYVFVKFYAPWCGHCKKMAPDYSKLAKRVHDESQEIFIAKLDATEQKAIASEYSIQGFPTLKFFIDGQPIDYQGAREEDPIYNWIQKKTGPASKHVQSEDEFQSHLSLKLSVMYLLPEGDDNLTVFQAFAAQYDDIPFAHSHQQNHKDSLDLTKKYGFVVFRNFDEGHKFLLDDEPLTVQKMKEFLEAHRYPYVAEFDQESANRIFGEQMTAFILMTDDKDAEEVKTFQEFAKNNKDEKMVFSMSAISSGFGQRLAEYIGVKDGPTARIITFKNRNLEKYIVNDLSTEGLAKALQDFKENKLEAHFKSAPVPEKNDEPVKVVVGDNFEELVFNDNYVLLEAYAPWCGHCKKLAPIYEDLAKKLANESDITIAKMDATENEHPAMPVSGFPTLKLFKPGSKTGENYEGDRSLKDLVKFLETQTGRSFEGIKSDEL